MADFKDLSTPKQIRVRYAEDGDRVAVPDPAQGDGSISYDQGEGVDYQRNLADDPLAKRPSRQQHNALRYDTTAILQDYQLYGFSVWYPNTTYGRSAVIRYKTGDSWGIFVSLIDDNTANPSDLTAWIPLDPSSFIPRDGSTNYAVGSKSTTNIIATIMPALSAPYNLKAGFPIFFRSNSNVAGAATLNLNGTGAKKIYSPSFNGGVQPVSANDIVSGMTYVMFYEPALDNGNGVWVMPAINRVSGVLSTRKIIAGTGLTGGGDLSEDRTLAVDPNFIASVMPAGAVMSFAMKTEPNGWLPCDGRLLGRGSYINLFNAIGTAWGSTDNNNFALPDFRGAFLRGWNNQPSSGFDAGRVFASRQNDDFKAHKHDGVTNTTGNHQHNVNVPSVDRAGVDSQHRWNPWYGFGTVQTDWAGLHSHTLSINNTGGHETRPINWPVLYCIKT